MSEQALLWELGELLVYDIAPELLDALPMNGWDFGAVGQAREVFAVEPVARLREFMRDRAAASGIANLYVLDGTLDGIPLPPDTADVHLTCRAIGWHLEEELVEIERVVRAGGVALHLGLPYPPSPDDPLHRRLLEAGYSAVTYAEGQESRTSYRKQF